MQRLLRILCLVLAVGASSASAADHSAFTRTGDVVYGRKFGTALTLDVFDPTGAGGHLSLTIGTQGGPGAAAAKDPVDRVSSAVQCVACFFPPTDFCNRGSTGDDAVGVGTLASFKAAFGPRSDSAESRKVFGPEISPLDFVTSNLPPTLVMHGDADKLVPLYQAKIFQKRCKEAGATCKLIVKLGADHGWAGMEKDLVVFADWFDLHLRGLKKSE